LRRRRGWQFARGPCATGECHRRCDADGERATDVGSDIGSDSDAKHDSRARYDADAGYDADPGLDTDWRSGDHLEYGDDFHYGLGQNGELDGDFI
jgi:hypothetical protein